MTADVSDWFRSITVLGIGFVAVIAVTLGLATILIPSPTISALPSTAPSGSADASAVAVPPYVPGQVGGTILVRGDVDAAFRVGRESNDGRYGLVGDEGRIFFEGEPPTVAQISAVGLELFLDPDDCTLTPGSRHDETGVADVHLLCEDVSDVRGNGIVTLEGTLGMASDLVGLRGDLPSLGGSLLIGERTVVFDDAVMNHPRFTDNVGQLVSVEGDVMLTIRYDANLHVHGLSEILLDGTVTQLPPGTCQLSTNEIGVINPHARQLELVIGCPALALDDGRTIAVSGSVMVEEVEGF